MTELKCPICNKPMKQATYDYDKKDNDDTLYMSIMPCDCVCNFAASKAVWELLADTKKKLDIAVDALKEIIDWDKCVALQTNDFVGIVEKALKQINQKEEQEDIEFQTSQFVWHLLELVETTSVKLQEKISTLIKENDSIFLENKLKKEVK